MDQFPQMLFRAGGSEFFHGGNFSTRIVHSEPELAEALAAGWSESTAAATAALTQHQAPTQADAAAETAPPTREELEQKAAELGIAFDGRWGDKRLAAAIAAKLAG